MSITGFCGTNLANIRSIAGISVSGIKELFGCVDGSECKVGLQTHHDTFVVAEDNGEANANGDKLDVREIFSVTFIGDDSVQFKGYQEKDALLLQFWCPQKMSGWSPKIYSGMQVIFIMGSKPLWSCTRPSLKISA